MIQLATAFAASFTFVFLKASQQRHVVHNDWFHVLPTSLAMAFCEYYVIALVVKMGYSLALVVAGGVGAGLGCMAAMWLHNKRLKRKAA